MKINRWVYVSSLVLLLIVNLLAPSQVWATAKEDGNLQDIGQKMEDFVADHKDTTAGLMVAVFNAKETIYSNSFGYTDIENQIPVTEDTVMEWGSVSKLLVWVSVMQLVEQGKINLDEDINIYLPEGFLKNRAFDTPLTMLNLMNHNAGFEESIICMTTGHEDRIISLEEYLSTFQPKQVFEPGKVVAYSNWSTTLAAFIIENVTGMSYDTYVRQNIFAPLGMNDSTISADLSDNQEVKERRKAVKAYRSDRKEITPNMAYIVNYPAGSCVSTLGDIQKFAQALLTEDTILFKDPAIYRELFTPSLYFPGTEMPRNYHGFWVDGLFDTHVIGHGGNTLGFSSHLLLDLENGIGMVILTNQAAELIYNQKMPELLFGAYQGSTFDYSGLLRSARTISQGPLKIYRFFSVMNHKADDPDFAYGVISDIDGMDYLAASYGDYWMIGIKDIATDLILLALYALSLIYCLFTILRRVIISVRRKMKKQSTKGRLPFWYLAGILLPLIPFVALAWMILRISSWYQWSLLTYRIVFLILGMLVPTLLLFIGYGWKEYKKGRGKGLKAWEIFGILGCMLVTITNIIYWQWGYFWMI